MTTELTKLTKYPFTEYHDDIPDVVSRFFFDHPATIDESGIIDMPEGFARPFYHKPTNTVGLLFSKTSKNLIGRQEQDGRICAKKEELGRCYIISARRCKDNSNAERHPDRHDYHSNRRGLRHDLEEFCEELRRRNQKHFTLFGAGAGNLHPSFGSFSMRRYVKTDIFTNGRLAYLIEKRKDKDYKVTFFAPTRRKDGSFVPVDLSDKWTLRSAFSKVSRVIANTHSYEEARYALMKHWGQMSSRLWDEKNIHKEEGRLFMAKKLCADFVNVSYDHSRSFLITTSLIGGGTALIKPELGIIAALTSTIGHTVVHVVIEKGEEGLLEAREKAQEARSKVNIDAYGYNVDISDHFKVQTAENMIKHCPHIDVNRFIPEEFEFLDNSQFSLLRDREVVQDNPKIGSLSRHLLFMHQRGFSATCSALDRRSRLDMFQSGIVRFMHERKGGNIVVFAQYRPDLCISEHLRLPDYYTEQFNGGIIRLEYDRRQKDLSHGLVGKRKNVSYTEAMREIEKDCLFSTQSTVPWSVRSKSINAVGTSFTDPESSFQKQIRQEPPHLPDIRSMSV